jgi:predicted AAA+ superfamily ATPase
VSLGVSSPAVGRHVDLLVDLLLVRRLRPWAGNVGKRLVRTPKVYIRDSGVAHSLLDIETFNDLLGHPIAGPSWEGFVIENLITAAGERCTPYFLKVKESFLVHSGSDTWPETNGVTAIGLVELMRNLST